MANPENTREVPFAPKPRDVRESDAARDSAIQDGTYGPNGDTSRSKPAYVPPGRSAPADGGGDRSAEAAKHFDSLLDHAQVQNNPDSSPRERNAAAEKIGTAVFKMKKLLPHMTKQHIASLITALKDGDMGAIGKIATDLGMGHPDDAKSEGEASPSQHPSVGRTEDGRLTWESSDGTKYAYANSKEKVRDDGDRYQ
jgi:hypothetical protein